MKKKFLIKNSIILMLMCLFGVLIISSTASATLFVSGDNTPAYYASEPGNDVFFENILQGGTSVIVHEAYGLTLGNNMSNYYDSLTGVTSSYINSGTITDTLLSGSDLFVTGLFGGALDVSEISAIDNFLDSGGSVLFMGDYTDAVTNINSALTALGSDMLLYGEITDIGNNYATGSKIATDPYTSGVSSFLYGATYGVSGGTSLFFDSYDRAFLAYEGSASVPEPATMLLLGAGLAGLAGFRKKLKKA